MYGEPAGATARLRAVPPRLISRVLTNKFLRAGIGIALIIIGATYRYGFVASAGTLVLLSFSLPQK